MTPPEDDLTRPDGGARALGRLLRPGSADGPAGGSARGSAADARVVHVGSRPETVVWGHLPAKRDAVVTVDPGALARIDTVSHQGMLTSHPTTFFSAFGVASDEVLQDVVDIYEQVSRPPDANGHVLTGPVAVRGAEPGDALEVRVLAADLRVDYGVNHSGPGVGLLPELLDAPRTRLLRTDSARERLRFADGITLPVSPFAGIMAVAPPGAEAVPSRPPGPHGGNLDLRLLTAGSRLFLPVHQPGAQFYVGDPHSAQGDGEVNGTAVEHSSSYTVEFVLHRGLGLRWPVADTPTHVVAMGIHSDLSQAARRALRAAIDLIAGLTDEAIDAGDAYALCSLGVDLGIAEAVNGTTVVHAKLPKSVFTAG